MLTQLFLIEIGNALIKSHDGLLELIEESNSEIYKEEKIKYCIDNNHITQIEANKLY